LLKWPSNIIEITSAKFDSVSRQKPRPNASGCGEQTPPLTLNRAKNEYLYPSFMFFRRPEHHHDFRAHEKDEPGKELGYTMTKAILVEAAFSYGPNTTTFLKNNVRRFEVYTYII
jgi:hypothetical protein